MGSNVGAAAFVAFWAFVAIVSVAGIIYDYRKKRLAVETLRQAIQSGHQLNPEVLDQLLAHHRSEQAPNALDPRMLKIGGIITIAAGIGIGFLSLFVAQVMPGALYPIMGAAVLTICVGIGVLISGRVLERDSAPNLPGNRGA